MPDQKKPTATTPPFRDVNHNGYLDGEDIRVQLRKEEQQEDLRTKGERGHGVIESLGFRSYTVQINNILARGQMLRPDAFDMIANRLNPHIAHEVATTSAKIAADPQFYQKSTANVIAQTTALGFNRASIEVAVADDRNFNDFAKTFKQEFPKGVKLEGKDMPEILAHLGGFNVQLPAAPKAPPERAKGKV